MDDEVKQLLKEQVDLLKKINRRFFYQSIWIFVRYAIIVGFIVFGFLQLQPFIDQTVNSIFQLIPPTGF
jgi:hypothetical protein